MDHMRISGTEPSSVILSKKRNFQKLKRDVPNVQKQAEAKRDCVINQQNHNFKKFNTEKFFKVHDSYNCRTCTELCEALTFLVKNIYVQFDGMVYKQIVGIHIGTNCVPLIADLF